MLLEWSAEGPDCVRSVPLRKIDLTADRGPFNQVAGLHIDYFYGDNPDRVVRQIRTSDNRKMMQEISILGPAQDTDKWEVLKSWKANCDETTPDFINTPHGRFVVDSQALRVIDTTTFQERPADAEVTRMIREAFRQPLGRSVEYYFSDDLSCLRVYGEDALNTNSEMRNYRGPPFPKNELGPGYYLQRGESELHQIDEKLLRDSPIPLGEWWDRFVRWSGAFRGMTEQSSAISDLGALYGTFPPDKPWNVRTHSRIAAAVPQNCPGAAVSYSLNGERSKVRVFDIAHAMNDR